MGKKMSNNNDTVVKLHEVAPPRITIQCIECETHCRVYRTEPALKIGMFAYCPVCGSKRVRVYQSVSLDHWEALARDYEVSVSLIQEIFKMWEPASGQRFGDFVRELKAEAKRDEVQSNTA